MDNKIIPVTKNYSIEMKDASTYGKIIKRSTLCSICLRDDCNEINLMRARDHLSYEDIIGLKDV